MSAIPDNLETSAGPPMTIPLRHFLVGLVALVAGCLVALAGLAGTTPGVARAVPAHLLLVGWVCLTIMGAMTQFVPVWSGVRLHSRRLAAVQLWLVAGGLVGVAAALATTALRLLPVFGAAMLAGFWVFVYNVARTLPTRGRDVTETHFAVALGFFLLVTTAGVSLAVSYTAPVFAPVGLARPQVVAAHATLAVFGAVLTTVAGALYQLVTMVTQTELGPVDRRLQQVETVVYPAGVAALAAGRLLGVATLARLGGLAVVLGLAALATVVAHKLVESRVPLTPILHRYAVVAPATLLWAVFALPVWLRDPLASEAVFGAPGTAPLLGLGCIGFVVFGTLYHVVPFIVWVHSYSDRLGFQPVPMVDDLYEAGLADLDFACLSAGLVGLTLSRSLPVVDAVRLAAGALLLVGVLLFAANVVLVLRRHSPHSVADLLVGRLTPTTADEPVPGE